MRSSPIRVGPNCNDKPFIREGTQGGGWGRRGQGPGGVGLCFSEWQVSPGASRPMRLAWDGFSLSLRRAPVCRCSSQTSASGGPRGNDLVQSQDVNTPAPQPRNPLPARRSGLDYPLVAWNTWGWCQPGAQRGLTDCSLCAGQARPGPWLLGMIDLLRLCCRQPSPLGQVYRFPCCRSRATHHTFRELSVAGSRAPALSRASAPWSPAVRDVISVVPPVLRDMDAGRKKVFSWGRSGRGAQAQTQECRC